MIDLLVQTLQISLAPKCLNIQSRASVWLFNCTLLLGNDAVEGTANKKEFGSYPRIFAR
jgi:hypothetical protein